MQYELIHADTCLSDYWGGHHLPHVATPAYPMTRQQLADAINSEINAGAVCGADFSPEDENQYAAMHAAVDDALGECDANGLVFKEVESPEDDEDCDCFESVYAYFVFKPVDGE